MYSGRFQALIDDQEDNPEVFTMQQKNQLNGDLSVSPVEVNQEGGNQWDIKQLGQSHEGISSTQGGGKPQGRSVSGT